MVMQSRFAPRSGPSAICAPRLNDIENLARESREPIIMTKTAPPRSSSSIATLMTSICITSALCAKLREAEIEENYRPAAVS